MEIAIVAGEAATKFSNKNQDKVNFSLRHHLRLVRAQVGNGAHAFFSIRAGQTGSVNPGSYKFLASK